MADEAAAPAPKKKGKLKLILLILVLLIVVGGGAAGAALYFTGGLQAGGKHEEEEDPDMPQLMVKEGADEAEVAKAKTKAKRPNGRPDPRLFQATYIPIEDPFTANLRGGESFVQVSLGLSTYYDAKVAERVELHKMAIRSAVLMVLSETDPVDVSSYSGKIRLKANLKNAVNDVLTNREGFGGIDDVYFTSFISQ